jgi:hypothetical protein
MNQLVAKYGEKVEEQSLTICSGTDYVNINCQHVVCPDAATAKVSKLNLMIGLPKNLILGLTEIS